MRSYDWRRGGWERRKRRIDCMMLRLKWGGSDDRIKIVVKTLCAIMSWTRMCMYKVLTCDYFLLFRALFPYLNICERSCVILDLGHCNFRLVTF